MLPDGYRYQELALPGYTAGVKGTVRGLVTAESHTLANLGDSWQGGNDTGGATGGGGGGGGSGGVVVTNVTWDDTVGQLVVDFSNSTQTTIPFSDCPPP